MRLKYFWLLFILGLFYSISYGSLNAHNLHFQKKNKRFLEKKIEINHKGLPVNNSKFLFENSFYKNGYSYQESMNNINQFFDFLGISLKSKELPFSFPENRIEKDSFLLWKNYRKYFVKQLNYLPIITQDINNGFNTTMGN